MLQDLSTQGSGEFRRCLKVFWVNSPERIPIHDQALHICSSFAFLETRCCVLVFSAFDPGIGVFAQKILTSVFKTDEEDFAIVPSSSQQLLLNACHWQK